MQVVQKGVSVLTQIALLATLVSPLFLAPSYAYAATIFSDGFESNSFSAWTQADSDWDISNDDHTGSYGAVVEDTGGSSDELRKQVSTAGYSVITLSYWYKIPSGLSSDDELYVQWYDGTTWYTIVNYDSTATVANWVQATHVLPAGAANNANFQFQFSGDSLSTSDKFRLDDVELSGTALPPPNVPPVALMDSYTATEDTLLTVPAAGVLSNDLDVNSDPLTAILVTNVTDGTLVLNANGSFTYMPDADFDGTDSFTYKANDGAVDSITVSVTILVDPVNDLPVSNDDAYSTDQDVPLTIPASGVLANDVDADGDSITAVLVSGPSNGTLTLNADGSFDYTPNPGFTGVDSFTYTACDSGTGTVATVTIGVDNVNDVPVAVSDAYSTDEDTTLTVAVPGILTNDSDADLDSLTAVLETTTSDGTLTLNTDGSFDYIPDVDFNGVDSFTYKANDGTANSSVVTVTITVNPIADVCEDGIDNDGDTFVDFPLDPGCSDATDDDEFNVPPPPPPAVCADGIDNDGDTLIDYPADPGCMDAADSDETDVPPPPPALCADGIDNDGDTLVDYPADPGCADAADNDETDPTPTPASSGGGGGGGPALGGGVIGLTGGAGGSVLGVAASAPQGQVLGESCGMYMTKYLRAGKRNDTEQVTKLQAFLNRHLKSGLEENGTYGDETVAAVRAFQSQYASEILAPWGITAPTGIVYRTTLRKINQIECPALTLETPALVDWSVAVDPAKPL